MPTRRRRRRRTRKTLAISVSMRVLERCGKSTTTFVCLCPCGTSTHSFDKHNREHTQKREKRKASGSSEKENLKKKLKNERNSVVWKGNAHLKINSDDEIVRRFEYTHSLRQSASQADAKTQARTWMCLQTSTERMLAIRLRPPTHQHMYELKIFNCAHCTGTQFSPAFTASRRVFDGSGERASNWHAWCVSCSCCRCRRRR